MANGKLFLGKSSPSQEIQIALPIKTPNFTHTPLNLLVNVVYQKHTKEIFTVEKECQLYCNYPFVVTHHISQIGDE